MRNIKRFLTTYQLLVISLISTSTFSETITRDDLQYSSLTQVEDRFLLSAEDKANAWGLSLDQWRRYRALMQGDAKYQFTNLDPIHVLGIYAETDDESRELADLLVRRNYERLTRARSFNRAYEVAGKEFIGDEPLIDMDRFYAAYGLEKPAGQKDLKPQIGDTLLFFTNPNTAQTLASYQRMKDLMSLAPVGMEIYFTGTEDEKDIQKWAQSARISKEKVSDGSITLNFDKGESDVFKISGKNNAGFILRGDTAIVIDL